MMRKHNLNKLKIFIEKFGGTILDCLWFWETGNNECRWCMYIAYLQIFYDNAAGVGSLQPEGVVTAKTNSNKLCLLQILFVRPLNRTIRDNQASDNKYLCANTTKTLTIHLWLRHYRVPIFSQDCTLWKWNWNVHFGCKL